MDFNQIKELIKIVNDSEFKSFQLSADGVNISMSKNTSAAPVEVPTVAAPAPVQVMPVAEAEKNVSELVSAQDNKPAEVKAGNIIKSPIVGTFYSSAKPGSPAIKSKGDKVKKGEVVCIVEAMKIMNEITSEFDGVVDEILVENEQLVEFGQPLFRIV